MVDTHLFKFIMKKNGDNGDTLAAAEAIGVTSTAIMRVCKGQRKTAGGYHWAYA